MLLNVLIRPALLNKETSLEVADFAKVMTCYRLWKLVLPSSLLYASNFLIDEGIRLSIRAAVCGINIFPQPESNHLGR